MDFNEIVSRIATVIILIMAAVFGIAITLIMVRLAYILWFAESCIK